MTHRIAGPMIFAVVLATAAACTLSDGSQGHDDDRRGSADPASVAALRAVRTATGKAGSARITSTTVMGDMLSMTTDGTLGWADGSTGRLTITYTGGQLADAMRKVSSTSMEARLLPDAYYAKVGDRFSQQMRGKHWVRYAYADLAGLPGGSGTYLKEQLQNTAPVQPVKLLLASGDLHKVGEERVRGKLTTHYTGTVDVADLKETDALRQQLEQAGVTSETVDIWVDGRDLLVKKVERGEFTTGRMSSTAYYGDYGVRVVVERPQASDTADFEDLMVTPTSTPTATPGA